VTAVDNVNLSAESIGQIEEILLRHIEEMIPEDEDETDFRQTGDYKHRYWDMTRELKEIRGIASLPGYLTMPLLQQVLKSQDRSLADLGYESEEEALGDLEALWDKVRLGMKESPLEAAVRMAEDHPVEFKTKRLSRAYQRFLAIAYYLQIMRGDQYIALPVVALAGILGVSSMAVSMYREYAKADGYLSEIGKAHHSSRMATKFRFRLEEM
jgi:hypothetical protein